MRSPRDIDAELRQLADRTRELRKTRVLQLGELVIACGADAISVEPLAGALLHAVGTKDVSVKEAWRLAGAAFFQDAPRTRRAAAAEPGKQSSPPGAASAT